MQTDDLSQSQAPRWPQPFAGYFANANPFMEEVEKLLAQGPASARAFVLDAEAIADIDTTGAEVLHQVLRLFADQQVAFAIARANPQLPPLLQRYHLLPLIGENRLYPTNRHAVAALRQEQQTVDTILFTNPTLHQQRRAT